MRVLHVVRGLSNSSGTTHIVGALTEEQARQGCEAWVYYVDKPPAVAFCQTEVTAYNEEDRKTRLVPFLSAHQARTGKTFYELFPPRR